MDGARFLTYQKVNSRRLRLRGLALPNEHGSWSILLEPLIAGIAVAPSPASAFIVMLFAGGFLARQPLKVSLTNLKTGWKMPHTRAAKALALSFLAFASAGLCGTWILAGPASLLTLAVAAPLAILQISYDVAGKSRRLIPELAGAAALSSSAAIAAHAAGWSSINALALSGIFVLRLIPSMLYVRQRLVLEKRKQASVSLPVAAHICAIAIAIMMASAGICPKLVVGAFVVLLIRAAIGLSPWRRKLRAMQIGILEIVFGAVTLLSVIIGHYLNI